MARRTHSLTGRLTRVALPLVLVATGALTACGGGSDKVVLRVTWWGSDTRHAYTKKLIELYQSKHPNVTIKPDYTGFSDYWNKLATSVAGGNAPDVMQQESRYLREYADRGALADLTPYLGSTIENANLDPSVRDTGTIGGKTFGIATGVNAFSIVANPAVFAKAGVQLPDDATWTWEQLRDVAARVTKGSTKGIYGLQELSYIDAPLEIFARQHGSGIYSADGKLALSRDLAVEWFAYVQSLGAAAATPPASKSVEIQAGGVDQSLVATRTGAMGGWWTNEVSALAKASGQQLKLLRAPGDASTPGTFFKPAMFWSLGARSKHPKEAAEFVNFLLNDPEAANLTLSDRGMPNNLSLRSAILPSLKPVDRIAAAFLDRIRPTIGAPAVLPPKGAGKVQTILQKVNEEVIFKRITPEKAADSFLQQAQAAIR